MSPTTHDFRKTFWGHNLASIELTEKKRWGFLRPIQVIATGTCWTPTRPQVGDTIVWEAPEHGDVEVRLTSVKPAGNVHDMSFWEGVITTIGGEDA